MNERRPMTENPDAREALARLIAETEAGIAMSLRPYERAKRLAPGLREEAEECRREATMATAAKADLLGLRAERLEQAADLLRILAQEQWRQREAAKIYLHGRMGRSELREITETWNDDAEDTP